MQETKETKSPEGTPKRCFLGPTSCEWNMRFSCYGPKGARVRKPLIFTATAANKSMIIKRLESKQRRPLHLTWHLGFPGNCVSSEFSQRKHTYKKTSERTTPKTSASDSDHRPPWLCTCHVGLHQWSQSNWEMIKFRQTFSWCWTCLSKLHHFFMALKRHVRTTLKALHSNKCNATMVATSPSYILYVSHRIA